VSLYRVHLTWNEKEIVLKARSLDLTHPYFVSIKEIELPGQGSQLIINPADDELQKTFGEAEHLMIPFQKVHLIEELKEETADGAQVKPFSLVDKEEEKEDDD
jgi:hypothetical protein